MEDVDGARIDNKTAVTWQIDEEDLEIQSFNYNKKISNASMPVNAFNAFLGKTQHSAFAQQYDLFVFMAGHISLHLWLCVPLVLLFLPREAQFLEVFLSRLYDCKFPSRWGKSQAGSKKAKSHTGSTLEPTGSQNRLPLLTTTAILIGSGWGLLWALLHIHETTVR